MDHHTVELLCLHRILSVFDIVWGVVPQGLYHLGLRWLVCRTPCEIWKQMQIY